jgi:DNA-directed RNA polymerase subunit L
MKISSLGNDAIQVQLDGEDYSVADIIHKELLSIRHVKFAGVAPPHPLIKTLTIQLHTDGSDANDLLKEAIVNAEGRTEEILNEIKKQFPDSVKPMKPPALKEKSVTPAQAEPAPEEKEQVGMTDSTNVEQAAPSS